MLNCYAQNKKSAIEITAVNISDYKTWLSAQDEFVKNYFATQAFQAKSGSVVKLPNKKGQLDKVILGVKDNNDGWAYGNLAKQLPEGVYRLAKSLNTEQYQHAAIAFGLGSYQFTPYKKQEPHKAQLLLSGS